MGLQCVRSSSQWLAYFRSNAERLLELPWDGGAQLGPGELEAVAESVREFQLGESSDGRRSLAIARAYAERTGAWGYAVFRQLRRALNLEMLISVLLTVELIAKVYYRALRQATASPLLRRIC